MSNIIKSILHNIGVIIIGFILAFATTRLDILLKIRTIISLPSIIIGSLFIATGFLLRVWATYSFYEHRMKVISLSPQNTLLTTGAYRFTRNPLYLGGNVFIFFGACLLLGSLTGLILTALHLPFMDMFVRREEKQLRLTFGEQWVRYEKQVPKWV